MLALTAMDPDVMALFFIVAVVCFAIAIFGSARPNLVAAGLCAFAIPFAWNALSGSIPL